LIDQFWCMIHCASDFDKNPISFLKKHLGQVVTDSAFPFV